MRSPTDVALDRHLSPVDRVAVRVTSPGVHWTPEKTIQEHYSINPVPYGPPCRTSPVAVGHRFGGLTVLGAAADGSQRKKGALYVCRCRCGYYTQRRARAVLNPKNTLDACGRCLQLQYLKRKDEFRQTGRNRGDAPSVSRAGR